MVITIITTGHHQYTHHHPATSSDAVSSSGDKGIPYVLEYPESTMAQALVKLANNLGE